mmetsp:Transcript_18631/g.71881  ORF Transcript_18631/g.71881 Transcript_18631/m.71881 type:complete len:474 (-) Transcript_18631:64-1485(-)|eukprot:CAMPEP_0114617702 /NCGR_PEP_ID=MMETSP0168-20121206/7331_1 /TAXON_ID=95228 ORGANISM="Vannella sp., Strain DIVA3 517/6/12" /NCGR_SAMPLE_ID=MMETSP0168 /ASSEMBLY_ACC=CAM_ASM_000044 /LENGTH=473 /DNA_ID=CAMNT_0001828841 /DNA_START=63 /DNA_END=1484 /DNA_ORIENTATION=-
MAEITIQVKMPGKNESIRVPVNSSDTVLAAKQKIAGPCGTPADRQRLIFCGRVLKDEQILSECKIEDNLVVHMVPRPAPGGAAGNSPAAAAQRSASQGQTPPATGNMFGAGATPAAGQQAGAAGGMGGMGGMGGLGGLFGAGGANPFAAFGGAGGQGDVFQNMMNNPMVQQMHQQMMQNPEMLQQMMQNPMVQQMNQQLMSNPELLRNVIANNPHMQRMMESNPQLAHIMNDPELLREAMRLSQNPELMRETMRNADRTMTHIENIPGGFNHLAAQYRDVTEPLTEATQAQANQMFGGQDVPQQQAPAVPEGPNPNNNPLPNPWAPGAGQGGAAGGAAGGAPGGAAANPFGGFMNMFGQQGGGMNQMLASMFQQPQAGANGGNADAGAAGGAGGTAAANPFAAFMQGMGGMGGMGAGAAAGGAASNIPPETRFAVQLQQLNDMGFNDQAANIRNLVATGGNVNACVERLLQGL